MKITLQQKIIEITKDTPVEKLIPAEEKQMSMPLSSMGSSMM